MINEQRECYEKEREDLMRENEKALNLMEMHFKKIIVSLPKDETDVGTEEIKRLPVLQAVKENIEYNDSYDSYEQEIDYTKIKVGNYLKKIRNLKQKLNMANTKSARTKQDYDIERLNLKRSSRAVPTAIINNKPEMVDEVIQTDITCKKRKKSLARLSRPRKTNIEIQTDINGEQLDRKRLFYMTHALKSVKEANAAREKVAILEEENEKLKSTLLSFAKSKELESVIAIVTKHSPYKGMDEPLNPEEKGINRHSLLLTTHYTDEDRQ